MRNLLVWIALLVVVRFSANASEKPKDLPMWQVEELLGENHVRQGMLQTLSNGAGLFRDSGMETSELRLKQLEKISWLRLAEFINLNEKARNYLPTFIKKAHIKHLQIFQSSFSQEQIRKLMIAIPNSKLAVVEFGEWPIKNSAQQEKDSLIALMGRYFSSASALQLVGLNEFGISANMNLLALLNTFVKSRPPNFPALQIQGRDGVWAPQISFSVSSVPGS